MGMGMGMGWCSFLIKHNQQIQDIDLKPLPPLSDNISTF